jgi:hypothetical protein
VAERRRKAVREKVRVPLKEAEKTARKILKELKPLTYATKMDVVLVGSILRGRPEVADIEFVIKPENLETFPEDMKRLGYAAGPKGRKYKKVVDNIPIEVYVAFAWVEMAPMTLMYTGDYLFNIAMRSKAKRRGYKLDQYGLWEGNERLQLPWGERSIFELLEMDWHEPWERSLAARQDLLQMARELRDVPLGEFEREALDAAVWDLEEERYLAPEGELILRDIHFQNAPGASLGSKGPIREWSPSGKYRKPKSESRLLLERINWEPFEWREPDEVSGDQSVWYGPEGAEGDVATTISSDMDGFQVCEYQAVAGLIENPEADFLKTCVFVDWGVVAVAGAEMALPREILEGETEEAVRRIMRVAVAIGVAKMAYFGGDEEWVDSLLA